MTPRLCPDGAGCVIMHAFHNVQTGVVMSDIKRTNVGSRLSDMAVFNGVVYLAGQVPEDVTLDMEGQTKQVLGIIDSLLKEAGTSKERLLMVQIFVANIKEF